VAPSTLPSKPRMPSRAASSALVLWLALNGLAALPFLVDRFALFKVFLNPAAPFLFLLLEELIVLAAWLRYKQLRGQGRSGGSTSEEVAA